MNDNNYATLWKQAVPLPSGIIEKSRSSLKNFLLSVLSAANRKSEENCLRCLFCHYIFDDQKKDFEFVINELKKTGKFIDTDTCIQMLQGKRKIDKRYYHLSFDDGFRNNFTNALPILKKHEIPAIFFVPSSLIEANWDDTKKYCLQTTRYTSVIEMLKWDDLRKLISLGYEIGSHTKTHARFSSISDDKGSIADEIIGSKKDLENKLDYECKYISWPYGKLSDVNEESLRMVRDAGYAACFGAYRGSVCTSTNIFSIPRHHFEAQWPIFHITYFARGNMEIKI